MNNINYIKSKGKYPLTAVTSPWMHDIMDDFVTINELTEAFGSPINLHHIPSFQRNIEAFQQVFDNYDLDGKIYFARKANKSKSLVKAAIDNGIGVDTASFRELRDGIELGGGADNLVLTAAVKTRPMVAMAIKHSIPIIIDNADELEMVNQVASDFNSIAHIGIRLSGFKFGDEKLYSRFGFDIDKDSENLVSWFTGILKYQNLLLTGFHFHLDGYSIEQRAKAILQTLDFIKYFDDEPCTISFLDIGGGILMNYLESGIEWNNFQERLQNAVIEKESPITFKNNGLGFKIGQFDNSLEGSLATYPYYNEINGPAFLESVLTHQDGSNLSVGEQLRQKNIQLRIEPGRSLLSQVGMTIAKVAHRKQDSLGNWLVGLEMNMSQLKSSSSDFLVDPYIIYQEPVQNTDHIELYFTGAYCLEQDVIIKRKLTFPKLPQIGDFAVFINTAGYMMHFYETEAHLFNLSKNLYITEDEEAVHIILPDDDLQNPEHQQLTSLMSVKASSSNS